MKDLKLFKNKRFNYIPNNYYSYPLLLQELSRTKYIINNKINILDFGCSNGKLLKVLAKSKIQCNIYGVDIFKSEKDFFRNKKK